MDPRIARALVLAGIVAMVVIRAPHGRRARSTPIKQRRTGMQEKILLALAWAAFAVTLTWVFSSELDFADYPLHPAPFWIGAALMIAGLWLFYRSHADLGTNWSMSLVTRQGHRLVTEGVYRRIRHPMYASFLIFSLGQGLVIPNWLAAPSYGLAMGLLIALRLPREERMMRDEFGSEYEAYMARTKRLIPGVW